MDNLELIRRGKQGDEEAKTLLVENNTGLIWSIARRFFGRGYEPEDLFQTGALGLVKAIYKFDESFGVQFSTYAVPLIMGEIKRFIRDDGIIKVSRSVKELAIRAAAVSEAITKETGEEPSVKVIAERLGVSPEELAVALDAGARPESLNAVTDDGNSEGKALMDKLECPENYEKNIIDRLVIEGALKEFPQREQKIIILRYFKQKTQSQIAQSLGISQVQVSRLEKKILTELKEKICG